jgi:hypothetical protein
MPKEFRRDISELLYELSGDICPKINGLTEGLYTVYIKLDNNCKIVNNCTY